MEFPLLKTIKWDRLKWEKTFVAILFPILLYKIVKMVCFKIARVTLMKKYLRYPTHFETGQFDFVYKRMLPNQGEKKKRREKN